MKKVYVGKVTNWFDKIGVAEIQIESAALHRGDRAMGIGRSTGVEEFSVEDMRVDFQGAEIAQRGVRCSVAIPAPGKLKRGDKIYKWEENI